MPHPATIRTAERFDGVQFLRFIAAFLVVVTHATYFISTRMDPDYGVWNTGSQGARLFFVISGFIMIMTARPLVGAAGGFRYFMLSRIVRIVPLYWALNILKIAQILAIPTLALANPTVSNVILSLLFVPSRNADGIIETFYGVGWTLNFEMAFYLLVGIALALRANIFISASIVLALCAFLAIFRQEDWPAITYFFNFIMLNFIWGMAIAELYLKNVRLPVAASVALIAVGSFLLFAYPEDFFLELEYAAIVAGVVWLEPHIRGRIPRWLMSGGDASYSLYLVHPVVGVLVAVAMSRLAPGNVTLALVAIVAGSLAVAAATFHWFERPVTDRLRAGLKRPAQPVPGTPDSADPGRPAQTAPIN
jgi:exopolysaccharide production protein ExoZ